MNELKIDVKNKHLDTIFNILYLHKFKGLEALDVAKFIKDLQKHFEQFITDEKELLEAHGGKEKIELDIELIKNYNDEFNKLSNDVVVTLDEKHERLVKAIKEKLKTSEVEWEGPNLFEYLEICELFKIQ